MPDKMIRLSKVVGFLLFAAETSAICQKTCSSDAQCKGFSQVSDLRYCVQGCCSTYNTAVAVLVANITTCLGGVEANTNTDANQYPWLALITQNNATGCYRKCHGALVAPGWVVSYRCYNLTQGVQPINAAYFYLDDPKNRQAYSAVLQANTNSPLGIFKIDYIGGGTPLAITPLPLNCDSTYLTSGTLIYWSFADDTSMTRTFVSEEKAFSTQTQCMSNVTECLIDSEIYYCFDAQSPYIDSGLLLASGSAGDLLLLGGAWHYTCSGIDPDTSTYGQRFTKYDSEIQQITGATCAS